MITKFATKQWDLFPEYWHINDTNIDVNGEGTAQRLLCTMGLELDEEIVDYIDDYLTLLDAQETPQEFLLHISDSLGNPPNMFPTDIDKYRNILSYIVSVYKVKGTVKGYEAFYNLLGFDVVIIEIPNIDPFYDSGVFYDEFDELLPSNYDGCDTCSSYCIQFTKQDDGTSPDPVTAEELEKLIEAVKFVEPINAILLKVILLVDFEEEFDVEFDEYLEVKLLDVSNYNNSLDYDDSVLYDFDNSTVVFSGPI